MRANGELSVNTSISLVNDIRVSRSVVEAALCVCCLIFNFIKMNRKRGYVTYCAVYGCLNTTKNRPDLSFFRIPPNERRRNKWLKLIHREDLRARSTIKYYVCERHFDAKFIAISDVRKRLRQTAFPSKLLPNQENGFNPGKEHKSRGCQVQAETTDANTQTVKSHDAVLQAPIYLLKLKSEICDCKKRLKAAEKETEINLFLKLCDKYLNGNLAKIVKAQSTLKVHHTGRRYSV